MRNTRTGSSQQEAITTVRGCFKNLLTLIVIETHTNGKMTLFVFLIRKHGRLFVVGIPFYAPRRIQTAMILGSRELGLVNETACENVPQPNNTKCRN